MSKHIIVLPFDKNLISRLSGKALVVMAAPEDDPVDIFTTVERENKLHCITLDADTLSEMAFPEEWKHIPLSVRSKGIDSFQDFCPLIPILRQSNVRILIDSSIPSSYTDIRILSSLGIPSGIVISKQTDWGLLTDLMTYSIYTKAKHATIEPFNYIANNYSPKHTIDFNAVYFDTHEKYIYLGKNMEVYLGLNDFKQNRNVVSELDNIASSEAYMLKSNELDNFFLKTDGCAYCSGWKICTGKYQDIKSESGCRNFFNDMIDASEFHQNKKKKQVELWQP